MSVKQNLFVSVFVHESVMMLNDVEYATFKTIVNQMSNYLFVSSLDAQSALGMRHFSFKVQNLPIFKVSNLRKENFNGLAFCYLSCTILRPKFEKKF